MKLWVDDERKPPDDTWVEARTANAAIRLIARNDFDEISLDHDDGHDSFEGVAYFIGEKYREYPMSHPAQNMHVPEIRIHSANPIGRDKLIAILQDGYGIPVRL